MPNARDRARTVLSDRPIPVAPVDEVLSRAPVAAWGGDRGLGLVRDIDPDGEEFGVRQSLGGPWSRVTGGIAGRGGRMPSSDGLPGGPWVYLKEAAGVRREGGLWAAIRRGVLLLASNSDVSGAASARWTGLVLEARRVSERLAELDSLPG